MTVLQLLQKARERIKDEESWCKGSLGIDKNNKNIFTQNKLIKAHKVCAVGALYVSCNDIKLNVDAIKVLAKNLPKEKPLKKAYIRITCYNDKKETTHANILALYDRAIKSLERKTKNDAEGYNEHKQR